MGMVLPARNWAWLGGCLSLTLSLLLIVLRAPILIDSLVVLQYPVVRLMFGDDFGPMKDPAQMVATIILTSMIYAIIAGVLGLLYYSTNWMKPVVLLGVVVVLVGSILLSLAGTA